MLAYSLEKLYANNCPENAKRREHWCSRLLISSLGFGLLEVAVQEALESLTVTGLVAGHLSRRRAGRFASYGETQEIQCFPLPFHS